MEKPRKKAESQPTENHNAWKDVVAEFQRTSLEKNPSSWWNTAASMNLEKDKK